MNTPVFFYSTGGSLMCDREVEGLTQDLLVVSAEPYREKCQEFYGGRYFVCETVTRNAAKLIAEALGGEFRES
jgi:hypothetical protein